jgi:ABC-2 type transport system ATP-binding protein
MLEVVDLSKSYRGVPAVRGLNLTARPGQVVGLLGPNGSGKSTTMKMLVGLLRPSSGVVRWRSADIQQDLLAYQALVGYVPEEPRLYDYLTAPEYLELVGGLRDVEPRQLERRVSRYLELFGLEHDIHSPMTSFSKGMRQKVLIAAALLHDPEIILLDEPNSGLDVATTLIMRHLIGHLTSRGRVIVYSSHDMDAVEKVCDEVAILHASQLVAHDSVARLREMSRAASLEQVFAELAIDQDVERIGAELAAVASS